MEKQARTRIAPSPTGQDLHIGNAYTALINYIYARKSGGQFVVRIEDTDQTRFVAGSESRILASLDWLGIAHDEGPDCGGQRGPYRQSERLDSYQKYAGQLVDSKHAYYCFCTPQRLDEMRKIQEVNHLPPMYDGLCKNLSVARGRERISAGEKYVIRLNVPDDGETVFMDLIRGEIKFENRLIDDQVILKSDGYPTYHLGVVVDDHLMGITHIIRGEEWISSTPKHILLYKFFGWAPPVLAHMPLLRNPDKSKLSKRKNPVWVSWYREQGFLPEAVVNYLATLAWSFPGGREIFTPDEMISVFDLRQVQTTAPIFNPEKLRWLNGEYLRRKSETELVELLYKQLPQLPREHVNLVRQIVPLVRDRMKVLSEFWPLAGFFFTRPAEFERPLNPDLVKLLLQLLESVVWAHTDMEQAIRVGAEKSGQKARDLFMELRLAVTGKTVGPPLLESIAILGKEETLSRLNLPDLSN